jgi:hypothetical protein
MRFLIIAILLAVLCIHSQAQEVVNSVWTFSAKKPNGGKKTVISEVSSGGAYYFQISFIDAKNVRYVNGITAKNTASGTYKISGGWLTLTLAQSPSLKFKLNKQTPDFITITQYLSDDIGTSTTYYGVVTPYVKY